MSYQAVYDPRHRVTLYIDKNTVWSFKAPASTSPDAGRASGESK